MTLLDLIPIWVAFTASLLSAACLWGAIRLRVLYSLWDPCSAALFVVIRLLPIGDEMLLYDHVSPQREQPLPR
jgi:hypothetical protein